MTGEAPSRVAPRPKIDLGLRIQNIAIGLSAIVVLRGARPSRDILDPFAWDVLLLSGVAMLAVGLVFSNTGSARLHVTLDRLSKRGSLLAAPDRLAAIKTGIEGRAGPWIQAGGIVTALAVFASFLFVMSYEPPNKRIGHSVLALFEIAWGYVAGRSLGRMASYGALGWYLKSKNTPIRILPGHIDGAAGLKPVGEFCFSQAMIAALPAIYLGLWSIVIPAWPHAEVRERYMKWAHPYLWLLALALMVEVLAFVIPMWWFHREMREQKQQLLPTADELSQAIAEMNSQLAEAKSATERAELNEQLRFKTKQYWDIELLPTWPVDNAIIKRFTIRNVGLLIPLAAEFAGLHERWIKLLQALRDVSS